MKGKLKKRKRGMKRSRMHADGSVEARQLRPGCHHPCEDGIPWEEMDG